MDGSCSRNRSRRSSRNNSRNCSRNNSRNSSLSRGVQNGRKKSKDHGYEPDLNICPVGATSKLTIEYIPSKGLDRFLSDHYNEDYTTT